MIGGGIAGMSAAYFMSERHDVSVVEAEKTLTYHTTGRSAALFFETYGYGAIRPLTSASRPFLDAPPADLVDAPILTPRGALNVARSGQEDLLEEVIRAEMGGTAEVQILTGAETVRMVPALREDRLAGGLLEPGAADIDVAGLHQAFVRGTRRRGGKIHTGAPVTSMVRGANGWKITAGDEEMSANMVVNASGAWGDRVAGLAGVAPVGLIPKRRTAFMVTAPEGSHAWPLVFNVAHEWYFKPDGSQLLCSPADETPSQPCDARPEEIDVALGIERINEDTTLAIRSVRSAWAGLRTFAPDGGMVIGFEPEAPGFFWLVGQGGTGIQTSPGAGMLAAALIDGNPVPASMPGLEVDQLSPARFR